VLVITFLLTLIINPLNNKKT